MRVILAAGGSGGHIFPSVALAEELEKAGIKDICFVSSKRRLDRNILESRRNRCFFLSVNPMPLNPGPVRLMAFTAKLFMDIVISLYLVAKLRPAVVVGFGGYSSGAISTAAKIFRVPVIIHEQNFLPGRANRILGRIACRIATSFRDSGRYFSHNTGKIVYSGNPLRLNMFSNDREKSARILGVSSEKLTVLVMGGSQGASFLNSVVSEAACIIKNSEKDKIQFIHLTGNRDYDSIKRFYAKNEIPGRVFSFLEKIDDAYAVSDLAVTRAGAAAVFELAYYAKPMILIPYPDPKNNQRSNAVYFSRNGAAVYKEEKDLSAENLAGEMLEILTDENRRISLARSAGRLSVPDAGKTLAEEVVKVVGERLQI